MSQTNDDMEWYKTDLAIFPEFAKREFDNDGLIACSRCTPPKIPGFCFHLIGQPRPNMSPHVDAFMVAVYLRDRPHLWKIARLRVVPRLAIAGAKPMFGVPIAKAILIAIKSGSIKSVFYTEDASSGGRRIHLMVHVHRRKESNGGVVSIEAWLFRPNSTFVKYVHAETADFSKSICHLDGAIIQFTQTQIDSALRSFEKTKGESYQKAFRLDGDIPINDMHGIMRSFFPVEELIDDLFEISHADPQLP